MVSACFPICGTVLNRLKIEYCRSCGAVLGPARYYDFITHRTRDLAAQSAGERLCVKCTRAAAAGQQARAESAVPGPGQQPLGEEA